MHGTPIYEKCRFTCSQGDMSVVGLNSEGQKKCDRDNELIYTEMGAYGLWRENFQGRQGRHECSVALLDCEYANIRLKDTTANVAKCDK